MMCLLPELALAQRMINGKITTKYGPRSRVTKLWRLILNSPAASQATDSEISLTETSLL